MFIKIPHGELMFTFVCSTPVDIDKSPMKVSLLAVCRGDQRPFWTASQNYSYEVPEVVRSAVLEKIIENIIV